MSGEQWARHALQWDSVKAPLRPGLDDVAWFRTHLNAYKLKAEKLAQTDRALLLGVTPELAALHRSVGIVAVDRCEAMVQQVLYTQTKDNGHSQDCVPLIGNWTSLPLKDHSVPLVLGDGVLLFYDFVDGVNRLLTELTRVLMHDGYLLLRVFISGPRKESLNELSSALARGEVANFHIYKWRLAMALQENLRQGVKPCELLEVFNRIHADRQALALAMNWPLNEINTIDAYRNVSQPYYFPTFAELQSAITPYFTIQSISWPDYDFGQYCPRIALTAPHASDDTAVA